MSYCLNPACQYPQNSALTQFCQSCGMALRLNDRYRTLKPIGCGGFGKTFLAIDEHLPSKPCCVIKQFCPENLKPERLAKATELFHQEAIRLEQLGQHPQIPRLLAHFTQSPYHYLIQSYVDGQNLAQELARSGVFSEAQIVELLHNLLPVLTFIHDRQVIHRDIKPANIVRRRSDRQLTLVDFGAAKFVSETALRHTGTVIGSAGYAAPEQASGKAVFASDLYSLGVTCVHLMTGIPPFDLYSFTEGVWVWQDYLTQPIHPVLSQILDRLLQPALNQRYASAAYVLDSLHMVHSEVPTAALQSPSQSVHRRAIGSTSKRQSAITSLTGLGVKPTSQPLAWRCVHTLQGHANSIAAIAISPNGTLIASASFDRTIKLWHLGTGTLISTFEGHLEPVLSIVFTPDGETLISGSVDDTIRIWDVSTETLVSTLTNTVDAVVSLSMDISPDGQAIVSGSDDQSVKIWHLRSGRLLRTVRHPRAVTAVDISSDGQFLVSACSDNQVRIWNFGTGDLLHCLGEHKRDVNCLAISPDSQVLASGSGDNTVRLWDLLSGKSRRTLTGHLDWVRALSISPDGLLLASGSDDQTIKLWSLSTGKLLHTLANSKDGHRRGVNAIAFSPDSRSLISGSSDRTLKIWRCL